MIYRCMAAEPSKRPGFAEIVKELQQLSKHPQEITDAARTCSLSMVPPPDRLQDAGTQHPICAA